MSGGSGRYPCEYMSRNAAEALREGIGRGQLARCIHKHTNGLALVGGLATAMNDSERRAAHRSQPLAKCHGRPIGQMLLGAYTGKHEGDPPFTARVTANAHRVGYIMDQLHWSRRDRLIQVIRPTEFILLIRADICARRSYEASASSLRNAAGLFRLSSNELLSRISNPV